MLACRSYQYRPAPAVEVGRAVAERGQRGVEVAGDVAGGRGPEEHPRGLEALVGGADRRCGAEEHGAREAPGERSLPEHLPAVDSSRVDCGPSTSASMTAFHESCRYCVSSEFTSATFKRDRARHDQRRGVSTHPQRVDDGVHQPQDAARALEALEARPVLVEAVEQLRVDRVGLLDPVLVAALARRAGKSSRAGGTSRRRRARSR